jgi:pyruvate/2-oxoglutarate dehydrogenase complex dihydrolipoamide acyltransferase (E2) component
VNITPPARERRHTLYFLRDVRAFAPVFLDTEIDLTQVRLHRGAAQADGRKYSLVTHILYSAGRVLARHPEANAAIGGRTRARIARFGAVNAKLTLDKTLNGHRVVLAAIIPDVHRSSLDDIQRAVDLYRDGDADSMPEFSAVRALHRLPGLLGGAAYHYAVRSLRKRPATLGTLAVTSLGHSAVDSFHSVGGTTITLGVGRAVDRPIVRDGAIVVAPVMRLSLTFDHRVIDGAEAADVLTELKDALESFHEDGPQPEPTVAHQRNHVGIGE